MAKKHYVIVANLVLDGHRRGDIVPENEIEPFATHLLGTGAIRRATPEEEAAKAGPPIDDE